MDNTHRQARPQTPEFPVETEVGVEIESNVPLDSTLGLHLFICSSGAIQGVLTSSLTPRPSTLVAYMDASHITREQRTHMASSVQRALILALQRTLVSVFGPGRIARQAARQADAPEVNPGGPRTEQHED